MTKCNKNALQTLTKDTYNTLQPCSLEAPDSSGSHKRLQPLRCATHSVGQKHNNPNKLYVVLLLVIYTSSCVLALVYKNIIFT